MITKGVLFFHDNVPAHRALVSQKKLAYLGFQCLDHTPHSSDLAPSDYQLIPGLKIAASSMLHEAKIAYYAFDAAILFASSIVPAVAKAT